MKEAVSPFQPGVDHVLVALACFILVSGCTQVIPIEGPATGKAPSVVSPSDGFYRLPYDDGLSVQVFDDAWSHQPGGRIDFFSVSEQRPHAIVAAAEGKVVAVRDEYFEQQSGRPASECRNNYVWIAHANGEWTGYSHIAQGSATGKAGLRAGDHVHVGQYLGDESAVGCAMLEHLHFEVAAAGSSIDEGGFLLDNEDGRRNRNPRFCGLGGGYVKKGQVYTASRCSSDP